MTDHPYRVEPRRQSDVSAESRTSVPALVTYWLLTIWSGIVASVVWMVVNAVEISGIMLSVLTGIIGTSTTLLVASISFWVGATQGGKAANERLSESSKLSNAALQKVVDNVSGTPTGNATITAGPDVDVQLRDAAP